MKKILILIASVALAACATTSNRPCCKKSTCRGNSAKYSRCNVAKKKANVYVYRINSRLGASQRDDVYIDNKKIGKIKNGTYLQAALTPGKHTIKIYDRHGLNVRTVEHKITVKKGSPKYVKVQWSPNGNKKRTGRKGHTTWLPKYGPKFVNVSNTKGKTELRTLRNAS